MPIALRCQRCGKTYKVSESNAGNPVQCSRCRFIMVVPHPPGSPPKASGSAVAPIQNALKAAAEMEQTARQTESPLVFHRPWYKPWVKPRLGAIEEEVPSSPSAASRADLRLIAIGILPLIVAAMLLYYLVPWPHPSIPKSSPGAAPNLQIAVTPDASPALNIEPFSPAGLSSSPGTRPTSAPASAAATMPNAVHWSAAAAQLSTFGPPVAYNSVAIRGPTRGMHLLLAAKGGVTWIGPEKNGITPYLLLKVSPPDDSAADALSAPRESGLIGGILMTRQTTAGEAASPGGPLPITQIYSGALGAKQIVIRVQCADNDPHTHAMLEAAAFSVRPATTGDAVLAAGATPPAYDRSVDPPVWEPEKAAALLLMVRKNAIEYTISPPRGLATMAPGAWMGQGAKLKLDGVATPLPLLRMEVQPLAAAEYHTAREWAEAQWTLLGRDADWGSINGQVFARVEWTDASGGRPAMCQRYVAIAGERFVSITIANWADEKEPLQALEASVRTIKIKRQRN